MTKPTPTPILERSSSHSVTLADRAPGNNDPKEEVTLIYVTDWRGTPVRVSMECHRRYSRRHSHHDAPSWSAWYVRAMDVHEWDGARRGKPVTATARERLEERLEPGARAWLESPAYLESRRDAFRNAIRRELADSSAYGLERVRGYLEQYRHELTPSAYDRLTHATNLFQRYCEALELAGQTDQEHTA